MSFAPVRVDGGGLVQVLDISPSGVIFAGSDTQGAYRTDSSPPGNNWKVRNKGIGASTFYRQMAAIHWSLREPGIVLALTGDNGAHGGLLAWNDTAALPAWTVRASAPQAAGNHAAPGDPVPQANYTRPAGRLIITEAGADWTFCGTYKQGVLRSANNGNDNFPVTCQMAGVTPAPGQYFCYGLFLVAGTTIIYGCFVDSTGAGAVWKCSNAHATTPNFIKLANSPSMPQDIVVLANGSIYCVAGNGGLYRSSTSADTTWTAINGGTPTVAGGGLDVSAGNSWWKSVDAYTDGSGTDQVLVAAGNPIKPSGATGYACVVQVSVTNPGGVASFTNLTTTLASINNATVPPGSSRAWWNSGTGINLGHQGFVNPQVRWDPNDTAHQKIYLTADEGFWRSVNGGTTWTYAGGGIPAFLGHAPAVAPNGTAGFCGADWGVFEVTDGDGSHGSGDPGIIHNPPAHGEGYAFAYAADSTAYVSSSAAGRFVNTAGEVWTHPPGTPNGTWTATGFGAAAGGKVAIGLAVFADAGGHRIVLAAGWGNGMWRYAPDSSGTYGWTRRDATIGTTLNAGGGLPGNQLPVIYAGAGVAYCFDRLKGIWRSNDYGLSWTLIWAKTSGDVLAGTLAATGNDLWVSAGTGLYRLPGATAGTVTGGSIIPRLIATLPGKNGPVAVDASGRIYCALQDTGSGAGLVRTADAGATWTDIVGDDSFAQCNCNPENIAIGPADGRVYVSGSNIVCQGFPATGAPAVSAPFTPVQMSASQGGTAGSIGLWFNQTGGVTSTLGTALVIRIYSSDGAQTITPPAGWTLISDVAASTGATTARVLTYCYLNNPGGLYGTSGGAATFTYSNTTATVKGRLGEWSTPTGTLQYADQSGPGSATAPATSLPATAAGTNTYTGGLAVSAHGAHFSVAPAGQNWNPTPSGWTADASAANLADVFAFFSRVSGVTSGPTLVATAISTSTNMTAWAAQVATFYALATAALTISTTSLPRGVPGTAYSATLACSSSSPPYTWALTSGSLPPGLSLSAGGVISGTPSTAGTYSFIVQATDAALQTATAALTLTVIPALTVTTTSPLPSGQAGVLYGVTLAASGGTSPYVWATAGGSLPPGLGLAASGTLAGTPALAGTYVFTAKVADASGQAATRSLTLVVTSPVLAVATTALAPARAGQGYYAPLTASGGTPPYTWAVTGLPAGLRLDAGSGIISGVPPVTGTYSLGVTVTDSASGHASVTLTLTVAPAPPPPPRPAWHFVIAAPQPDGTAIAEVTQAQARTLTVRAGPGTYHEASVDVTGDSAAALAVTELQADLQVIRAGTVLFCGRLGATQDTLDASQHRFAPVALDYKEELRRRSFAYGGGPSFTNVDKAAIAWALIGGGGATPGVQSYPGGNLGIAKGTGAGGIGQSATINYTRQDFCGAAIDTLAQTDAGFDWDITPYGQADLRLDIWAPARGGNNGVVLEYGGALVSSVTRNTDPSAYANSVFLTGTTVGGTTLYSTPSAGSAGALDAPDIASRREGRWDALIGTQITTQAALDAAAAWYLASSEAVLPSYTIVLYAGAWQGPQHIWIGDQVLVRIKSGRLNVNDLLPVTEMAFALSADGVETLTMTVGRIPFRLNQAIPKILRRLRNLEAL